MSKLLQQQLDRLQHDHPIVRRYAVASIFKLLAQHQTYNSKAGHDALQQCFKQSSKEVIEETVQQLHAFVPKPGLSQQDAIDMILAAIAVPGATVVVPSLVGGLFALLHVVVQGTEQAQLGSWRAHPLNKALLAQRLTQPSLLLGMQRTLTAASQADAGQPQLLQQLLLPFVSFVLLQPDLPGDSLGLSVCDNAGSNLGMISGKHLALKAGLHAQLVRAVCTLPPLQPLLLAHLTSYLAAYPWADPLQAAWLTSLIPDLIDAVQSVEGSLGDSLAEHLAVTLIQLVFEGQQCGLSLLPFLAGLHRLAADWPGLLTAYVPLLGCCLTTAGNAEAVSLLRLMAEGVQMSAHDCSRSQVYGLLALPLMSSLALHPSQSLKAWAGHLLTALQPNPTLTEALPSVAALPLPPAFHGLPCLFQQASHLLKDMWTFCEATDAHTKQTDRDSSAHVTVLSQNLRPSPLGWLGQLQAALQQIKAADNQTLGDSEALLNSQQDEVMRMILTALLHHPQLEVQAAAAEACGEAVQAFPLSGISFLPLVIYKLRSSVAEAQQGNLTQQQQSQHAAVQLALMRAIPCMAMHQTALPFVQRALMPFSQPGAPELLHAMSLNMHTQMWLTTGRGFTGVLGGLSGFSNTYPHASDMLRTVRAACVRDVCAHDSTRGVELVRAIQECVGDKCESVAALGLQAIALLCEDDVLEFYAAWRVVHKALPKMPHQELVAAEWVSLLRHGDLDADVYPDKATVIIDMLWSATKHASPKVRAAAYSALAAYPMDLLETLEALRPLQQCVQLLVAESDTTAAAEAEVLVGKAIAHEHMRRRRYIGTTAKAMPLKHVSTNADPSSVEFQLTQALPKQLLQQSAHQARQSSQGVTLLLWGPPPPAQGLPNPSKGDSAQAAQQAEAAYHQAFEELTKTPSALGTSQPALLLYSWERFLARWLSAGKAAHGMGKGGHQGGQSGATESAGVICKAIASSLEGSSPTAAENAAAAAAALCAVLPAGSHGLVTELVQQLQRGMASQSASLARACASALGPATAHLHPTDTQTRQDASQCLLQALSDHPSSSFKAACAHSLGLLAAGSSPASSSSKASAAHRDLAIQIIEGLLRMLCTLCPAVLAPAQQLVESWSTWMHADCLSGVQSSASHDEDSETVLGVMSGLAHAVPALEALAEASGEVSPLVALLQMLHTIQIDLMKSPSTQDADFSTLNASEVALLEGSCIAQAAVAVAAAEHKQPAQQQQHFLDLVARAVQHLKAILAKSKHGRLTGVAASSLGTVLNSALAAESTAADSPSASNLNAQQAPGSAQHAQHDTAQQTDLTDSHLRGALSDIMGANTQVTKLPSAAMGKQGVALGLVALFGGSRVGHKGLPGALVDRPGWGSEAKQALQVVVQLALHEADPRVATVACWGLAVACHAQRQKKGPAGGTGAAGGSDIGAQMRALTGVPEDGAMRALVHVALTEALDNHPQMTHPVLAGVLRSLADAPRLPPLDWGTPLKRLLGRVTSLESGPPSSTLPKSDAVAAHGTTDIDHHASQSGADAKVSLGAACLLLALKHGSIASHNLGELLDELMSQQQFAQLPGQLQQMLLIGLPEVLQSLSHQRATAAAGTLGVLCTTGSISSTKESSGLSAAAWVGLARYTNFVQEPDSAGRSPAAMVTEALHKAVRQLLRKLPLPPYLLPGERLPPPSMDLDTAVAAITCGARASFVKGKGQSHGAERNGQSLPQSGASQRAEQKKHVNVAWGAACACLQMMPKDKMAEVLRVEEEEVGWASGSAFATAVMVQMNSLPVEALQPVRHFCVSQRAEGMASVLSSVAAAVQQVSAQQTMLLDTLDAVLAGEMPDQALQLFALMVAHWQGFPTPKWPLHLVTALTPEAAVTSLPYTLPALLERKLWHGTAEPVTRRLIRLLLPAGVHSQAAAGLQASSDNRSHAQNVSQIAASCLVALRQQMADDAWQHMPQILDCRM